MLDVRLIGVIPPTGQVAQPSSAQAVSTQGAQIVPNLPTGSILSGFIVNRDPQGNPILRTAGGDFVFSSNLFLKIGSEVVLRIQNNAGKQTAHLVSVNGQSPELAAAQSAFADEPDVLVGRAPSQSETTARPTLAPGQTLAATVLLPAPHPTGKALSPGTSLLLSLLSLPDAAPKPTSSQQALSQLAPSSAASAALTSLLPEEKPANAPPLPPEDSPLGNAPQTARTGVSSPAESVAVASNAQAARANFAAPLGQPLQASVLRVNADGSALIQTAAGVLRLPVAGRLAPGQTLTVAITSIGAPNPITLAEVKAAPPLPPAPLTELARQWSSLAQIFDLLGLSAAETLLPGFTPPGASATANPPPSTQAASQSLFFLAALGGGNFRSWMGASNLRTLEEKGYTPLIRKAEAEFQLIARAFADAPPGQWQAAFIPVLASGELTQLRAFIKREKKKNENGAPTGDEDTRFVLEMDLSQLGEMQMDGLVKRRDATLRFDLLVRSNAPLHKQFERDIEAIYHATAELTGYRGQLQFISGEPFTAHPLTDLIADAEPDVLA